MKEQDAGTAFRNSLNKEALAAASSAAGDILKECARSAAIDRIPVLGWIVSASQTVGSVRDRLLARKVCLFLEAADGVSTEELASFVRKLDEDSDLADTTVEIVLETLDKVSRSERARYLGCAFRALLSSQIDKARFSDCAELLERLTSGGLESLDYFYSPRVLQEGIHYSDECPELVSLGLLEQKIERGAADEDDDMPPYHGDYVFNLKHCEYGKSVARAFGMLK